MSFPGHGDDATLRKRASARLASRRSDSARTKTRVHEHRSGMARFDLMNRCSCDAGLRRKLRERPGSPQSLITDANSELDDDAIRRGKGCGGRLALAGKWRHLNRS